MKLFPTHKHRVASSIAWVSLLSALTGCQAPDSSPSPTSAASSPTESSQASHVTCPASTFDDFLTKFMNDASIQERYVANPLESDTIDANAEPEPAPVKTMLAKEKITFPIMPDAARQKRDGLTLQKTQENATGFAIKLAKPDTDYQTTFYFRSAEGCWQLYRTEDDSL